jgi:hypothetical protein
MSDQHQRNNWPQKNLAGSAGRNAASADSCYRSRARMDPRMGERASTDCFRDTTDAIGVGGKLKE